MTSTYSKDKSIPFPHVTKMTLLAPFSIRARDGDMLNCRYNKIMKKAWVYKRKGVKGYWVGWYEGSKRKAKALPTKALAEHCRNIKYTQLNSDVFTSIIDIDWRQMRNEYHHAKQVDGLEEVSIYEALLTLRHFERLTRPSSSRQITQQTLDIFILERSKEVKKSTLNKDIRNMSTFLNWAAKNRYVASDLEINEVKTCQKPVIALSPEQVRDLMGLVSQYPTLRLRILLAVTTGLRRGDIEAIRIGNIHFDRNTITTRNRKAKKAMAERPIPEQIITELSNYVATLSDGQELLFTNRLSTRKTSSSLSLQDLRKLATCD